MKALDITKRRADDLEEIVGINIGLLDELRAQFTQRSAEYGRYSTALAIVVAVVGRKPGEKLLSLVTSLRRLSDENGSSASEVVEALTEGFRLYGWEAEKLGALSERREAISQLIASNFIHNIYKTTDLYFDVSNHLHSAKIITDIVPVLNDSKTAIGAMILRSNLNIVYSDRFENETYLSISLKKEEIEKIRDYCNRALEKIDVVQSQIESRAQIPVITYAGKSFIHD